MKTHQALIFAGLCLLPACAKLASIETSITGTGSLKTIYELRSGYDAAFLAPARAYKDLALCAAGQKFTVQAPCSDPVIVQKLQQVDQRAVAALDAAEAFARANPGSPNITTLYSAALLAVQQAEAVVAPYVIK